MIRQFALITMLGLSTSTAGAQWYENVHCSVQPYCGYWAPAPQVCLEPSYATFCEVWRTFPSGASYAVRWYWLGVHQ